MNSKPLSFNAEPFEAEAELEGTFQGYEAECNDPQREGEFEWRRLRGRSGYSRPQPAHTQGLREGNPAGAATQAYPVEIWIRQTGGIRPQVANLSPKPPRLRFPILPVEPYPWPPPFPKNPEPYPVAYPYEPEPPSLGSRY